MERQLTVNKTLLTGSAIIYREFLTTQAYAKVNELFAAQTVEAVRQVYKQRDEEGQDHLPAPSVWLHDYHLMLAANTIRCICDEEGLEIRMGFFLHIPFPSFDIIRIFPWVDEILMGMLGCDLVGFHTEDYCLNFVDCCQRLLGCQLDRKKMIVQLGGRVVQVKALPIGIPYARFENLALSAPRVYPQDVKVSSVFVLIFQIKTNIDRRVKLLF